MPKKPTAPKKPSKMPRVGVSVPPAVKQALAAEVEASKPRTSESALVCLFIEEGLRQRGHKV